MRIPENAENDLQQLKEMGANNRQEEASVLHEPRVLKGTVESVL
jgi:hypothetical protein